MRPFGVKLKKKIHKSSLKSKKHKRKVIFIYIHFCTFTRFHVNPALRTIPEDQERKGFRLKHQEFLGVSTQNAVFLGVSNAAVYFLSRLQPCRIDEFMSSLCSPTLGRLIVQLGLRTGRGATRERSLSRKNIKKKCCFSAFSIYCVTNLLAACEPSMRQAGPLAPF